MQKIQNNHRHHHPQQHIKPENSWCLVLAVVGLIGGALLFASLILTNYSSSPRLLCWDGTSGEHAALNATALQLEAILHYATSRAVPQQSFGEISASFDVLRSLGPSNFLVFGLGRDSLMWAGLNLHGRTLFLEEDPLWVQAVLKDAPALRAHSVPYRTKVSEADQLLHHYRTEPDCSAKNSFLRGNHKCRLALDMLPDEVYDTEWDMIMVDAPRGYFPEAPGRMSAIYSAAVMARNREKSGVTHVFVHDVDRMVEKMYAEAFLCRKHLVKAVGRLWHFQIPPAANINTDFC
ncbi:phosphoacetylglucosamine mutase [Orobanche hederae]